jgi:hypothetical protein
MDTRRRRAHRVAVAALALAAATAVAWPSAAGLLRRWLGPPVVSAAEAYTDAPGAAVFDNSTLCALLQAHVDEAGGVDYEGLHRDAASLDAYLRALASAPFSEMGRDEKLAFLLNAYNAFTLRLVLDYWPVGSVRDIPSGERWKARRWVLAGETVSLDEIEHDRIRPRFREPRIHFALVCAARSCPPLRAEAYTGARLEAQLADQARRVHRRDRWLRFDPASGTLHLTRLYDWYASDFLAAAPSIEEYVAAHEVSVRAALAAGRRPRIGWLPYDWSLNAR